MELKRKTLKNGGGTETGGEEEDLSQSKESLERQIQERLRKPVNREAVSEKADETEGKSTQIQKTNSSRLIKSRVVLMAIALFCLILSTSSFLFLKSKSQSEKELKKLEPPISVMRPIPQPDYREMLDFLLQYESAGQKMITAIRMEIGYQSPTRYQNFKEQNVAFRDAIYTFLLKQNLYGNSVKSWHSILEKDLLDFLMAKLPQSYPDKILLTQVENL